MILILKIIFSILLLFLVVASSLDNEIGDVKLSNLSQILELGENLAEITLQGENITEIIADNTTITNASSTNCNHKFACIVNKTDFSPVVLLENASALSILLKADPNVTSSSTTAHCMLVLFYSRTCPFSCQAAPHFNALPRAFPYLRMFALDVNTHHDFNAQLGIVGVPTLLLFHNGRPAARFNETTDYSLDAFARFVTKHTGLSPEGKFFVTSADFGGPVPSVPIKVRDYCLILSWVFITVCLLYLFYLSHWYEWLVDAALSAWREAEAQHPHND